MNSGQYFHDQLRLQSHGLPLECSYDESAVASSQPAQHQMPSYDVLAGGHQEEHFFNNLQPPLYGDYNFSPTTMPISNVSGQWQVPSQTTPSFQEADAIHPYAYSSAIPGGYQDGSLLQNQFAANIPRTLQSYDASMLSNTSLGPKGYDPNPEMDPESSAYLLDPNREETRSNRPSYDYHNAPQEFTRLSTSPKIENDTLDNGSFSFNGFPPPLIPKSESSDDSAPSSREMTAVEVEDHGADEPYAKLIYRALMSAPHHAMVLQEIYQWFRDNTNKGSSDTKGWMNSIRHNLSMNAAFKKTERKIPGDETKKSTEWVLEDFAIKDGVQSTTRYRKGNGTKKFARSENPAPSRQISGRRGGLCAAGSRVKSQRQRTKDESDLRRATPRIDTGRQQLFNYDRTPQTQRQLSPQTPENMSWPNPYIIPKDDQIGMSYGEICLGDVQGVLIDDDSPLFADNQDSHYHNPHSICASRF